MFNKLITNTSVHLLIPLFFIIAVLFLIFQTYVVTIPQIKDNQEIQLRELSKSVINHSKATINNLLKEKMYATASKELQLLYENNKNIRFAAILDDKFKIVYKSDGNYSNELPKNIEDAVNNISSEPYIYKNETPQHFFALTAVNLDVAEDKEQYSYLLLEYDYTENLAKSTNIVNNLFLLSLAAAVVIFLILGSLVYLFFLKKIELLHAASKRLKDGDYGFKLEPEGFKEVTTLIESFNKMSLKLQNDVKIIKENEKELRHEKDIAQNYLDIVGVMILVLDKDYNVQLINKRGCEIIGYELEEVIGRNWIKNFLPERFRNKVANVGETITHTEVTPIESFINPILTKDGTERIIAWNNRRLYDKDGNVAGVLTSGEDITKKIEQDKLLKKHTRQAQMGEMISMIAHQWRQPLASIAALSTQMMLKEALSETPNSLYVRNLKKIEEQVAHLSQTISDFRNFFMPNKQKESVLLSKIVEKSVNLLDYAIKSNAIKVVITIKKDSNINTFKNELIQVLMTMIKNSMDAFSENHIKNPQIEFIIDRYDTNALLQIKDNAGGIESKIINDIFLPYFSSKDEIHGTGLGLYMSKIIVEDNCNGKLDVKSENDTTMFSISLPLYLKD